MLQIVISETLSCGSSCWLLTETRNTIWEHGGRGWGIYMVHSESTEIRLFNHAYTLLIFRVPCCYRSYARCLLREDPKESYEVYRYIICVLIHNRKSTWGHDVDLYPDPAIAHDSKALHTNAQVPVSLLACYSCTQALCSNINTMTLVCSRLNRVSNLSPVGSAQGKNRSEMTVASWCNPRQGPILSAAISKRISDPPQQTLHRKYAAHYAKSYSVY